MKVSQYLDSISCDKISQFSVIEPESERQLVLSSFLKQMSNEFQKGSNKYHGFISKEVIASIAASVNELFQQTLSLYSSEWFGQDWRKRERQQMDKALFSRFLSWFLDFIQGATVCQSNVPIHLILGTENNPLTIENICHLIIMKSGRYYGLSFSFSKTKKGLKGKSPSTRIDMDLSFVLNKCFLEEKYSHITIVPVYLGTGEEKSVINDWRIDSTSNSNLFFLDFEDCYDENCRFDGQVCFSKACASINATKKKNCDLCSYSRYCKLQHALDKRPALQACEKSYHMPTYDQSQMQVVEHKAGPMLCCAGPGSGKTASLVGRVQKLVSEGNVYPEFMLLISFTEKAAAELRERISSFLDDSEMPRICTLNSIGYEVIKTLDRQLGIHHKLITDAGEQRIVTTLLNALAKPLTGISYKQFTGGEYSTVATVTRYIKRYLENPVEFMNRHAELCAEEWNNLTSLFSQTMQMEHYIGYDEQITLAVDILKNEKHKDILDALHAHYQYVMVDEYQDINEPQNELIRLLSGKNGNLVCIGDDDQAIYAWRGGSSKYMEHFHSTHPDAAIIKLQNNYRSTKNIVGICNEILRGSDATRIEKHIIASKNMPNGYKIPLIDGNSIDDVSKVIENAVNKGYSFKDIAIIATKNSDLEMLHEELPYPTTLASAYVRNDFLFSVIYYTLGIVLKMVSGFNPYAVLGILYDMPANWYDLARKAVFDGEVLNDPVFHLINFAQKLSNQTPEHYIARIAAILDLDDSVSEETLLHIVDQSAFSSLQDLYFYMQDMIEFHDDLKLEYPSDKKITLITAHSAKGKEYPCVIVYDADTYRGHTAVSENDSSQDRRLLYVTVSRAQQMLFLMKQKGSTCLLDESIYLEQKQKALGKVIS